MMKPANETASTWTTVISAKPKWFDLHLRELWQYRDLVRLFVMRDFVVLYKQTILGPIWFLLQPFLTSFVFVVVFSNIAGIPTDTIPPFLFYLSGVVIWNYFSNCIISTSNTFVTNSYLFNKVYFPRLAVPVSVVFSNLLNFTIQFMFFLASLLYFLAGGAHVSITPAALLLPLLLLHMAALGLGCGIIVSSLTTKYRDLVHLVTFGVQLWMFATPLVYPASSVSGRWHWLLYVNPMAPVIEVFRAGFLGSGTIPVGQWLASGTITLMLLLVGILLFSRIDRNFTDTV